MSSFDINILISELLNEVVARLGPLEGALFCLTSKEFLARWSPKRLNTQHILEQCVANNHNLLFEEILKTFPAPGFRLEAVPFFQALAFGGDLNFLDKIMLNYKDIIFGSSPDPDSEGEEISFVIGLAGNPEYFNFFQRLFSHFFFAQNLPFYDKRSERSRRIKFIHGALKGGHLDSLGGPGGGFEYSELCTLLSIAFQTGNLETVLKVDNLYGANLSMEYYGGRPKYEFHPSSSRLLSPSLIDHILAHDNEISINVRNILFNAVQFKRQSSSVLKKWANLAPSPHGFIPLRV